MKNNIEYYQHFIISDSHAKFKMLRGKYGWAGDGRFWALNNRIAGSKNCILDLSEEYNKSSIAYDLNFSEEEFEEFINYLADKCKLIIRKDEKITTNIVQENFARVMAQREYDRKRYKRRFRSDPISITNGNKHATTSNPKRTDMDTSQKVEIPVRKNENSGQEFLETKEKKKKVNKTKEKEINNTGVENSNIVVNEIIYFLNTTLKTNYKPSSQKTKTLINARLNEGYKLEDFKKVILKKTSSWKTDEKMQKFLRPQTLFSTNFESYLNEIDEKPINKKTRTDHNIEEAKKFIEERLNGR